MEGLEQQLLKVTRSIEKQVDAAIERIDNLDVNDLEQIKKTRIDEMKKQQEKRQEWLKNGHGQYEELPEEKMFFEAIKASENVVVHFFTSNSQRCPIVDMHLKILAPKHIETRFIKMNAEKCPFLAENLKIKTIPTIVLVHNNVMVDKIVGFTQLGNCDDFSTETLEWRIAQNSIINYEGDLTTPPDLQDKKPASSGKKIRDGAFNRDDDLDIEEYAISREDLLNDPLKNSTALNTELTPEEAAELGLDDN